MNQLMRTNNILRILLLTILVTLTGSVYGQDYLTVSCTSLTFSSENSVRSFHISSNVNWTIVYDVPWLSVDKGTGAGDQTVIVTVQENTSFSSRYATITVSGNGIAEVITVTQTGIVPPPPPVTQITFSADGGTQTVPIACNGKWVARSDQSWLALSPTTGEGNATLTIAATENNTTFTRTATVTITKDNGSSLRIIVAQVGMAPYLTVSATNLFFPQYDAMMSIYVASNIEWSVSVEGGSGWLTVTPVYGYGDCEVRVIATKNENSSSREASITVHGAGLSQVVRVASLGKEDPNSIIEYYFSGEENGKAKVLNLSGKKVGTINEMYKLPHGIYIVNGIKILK